jgi:hypothetical protein
MASVPQNRMMTVFGAVEAAMVNAASTPQTSALTPPVLTSAERLSARAFTSRSVSCARSVSDSGRSREGAMTHLQPVSETARRPAFGDNHASTVEQASVGQSVLPVLRHLGSTTIQIVERYEDKSGAFGLRW